MTNKPSEAGMSKPDGGQVFPTSRQVPTTKPAYYNWQTHQTTDAQGHPIQMQIVQEGGMTLRQFYAASAVQGMLSGEGLKYMEKIAEKNAVTQAECLAAMAFEISDAMIKEGQK